MNGIFVSAKLYQLALRACLGAAVFLSACAPMEPINGCALAAANQREVLRARAYLYGTIPAHILALHYAGDDVYHAALIYHLPEGWCAYDDTFGTRRLQFPAETKEFPPPLVAARAASPGQSVDDARWLETMPHGVAVVASSTVVRKPVPTPPQG